MEGKINHRSYNQWSEHGLWTTKGEAPKPSWVHDNVATLNSLGWQLDAPQANNVLSSYASYIEAGTTRLIDRWVENSTLVQVNIVTVVPNKDLLKMPTTSLGYIASTLSLIADLKDSGVSVRELRIMSPSYLHSYCMGGNLSQQLRNAEALQELTRGYKEAYHPELGDVEVVLDTGNEIGEVEEDALMAKIRLMCQENPELLTKLSRELGHIAKRNNVMTLAGNIPEKYKPIVYLLGHPEAWGYGGEGILYDLPGTPRINYMACSELRSLIGMTEIESAWERSDVEIASVVSNYYITAPYLKQGGETTLGKLLEMIQVPSTGSGDAWASVDRKIIDDASGSLDILGELLKGASLRSQGRL